MIQNPFFILIFSIMANIKLGAIITNIAGSVGGSTFRRTQRGIILYNKQGRQIKSAFAQNSVKNRLGAILSSWSFLDGATRSDWEDLAPLYPQKNKFGDDVTLTGRQFYTKLNTQLIPVRESVDLATFNDVVFLGVVESVSLDMGANDFIIVFSTTVNSFFVLVSVFPLRSGGSPRPTRKAFPTYADEPGNKEDINIFGEFLTQYPNAEIGQTWGVNIRVMNSSGFQTSVQSFSIVAE
jgi:hypothetical protein